MADWKFLGGITALGGLIGYLGAKTVDSKKLPAGEKAVLTGASTGATMEGLETLMDAESFSALDYELNRNDCCELWVEKLYDSGKIGFGEAGNLLAAIEMDGLKCSQLGGAKCNKKAESHNFSQKSAEGDYEPSFNSLKERIEWMEFAVGDENWYQYEEDYIDVVLDIEEWNENNANNSKLSNLVKRYKKRTGWMDAESFAAESKGKKVYVVALSSSLDRDDDWWAYGVYPTKTKAKKGLISLGKEIYDNDKDEINEGGDYPTYKSWREYVFDWESEYADNFIGGFDYGDAWYEIHEVDYFEAESKNARISWKDSCKHGTINQMGGVNYCEKQFEGKCEPCGNRFCKTHLFTTQAGTFCFSCLPVELGADENNEVQY